MKKTSTLASILTADPMPIAIAKAGIRTSVNISARLEVEVQYLEKLRLAIMR